jgi:hypothetical protein
MTDNKDKKEVCRSFRNNNGECRFGSDCKYEHTKGEPIAVPPRDYKPKGDCKNWAESKSCRFGDRCRYLHGADDKRESYRPQKTGEPEICRQFQKKGSCRFGDKCRNKHVEGDKQASKSESKDGGEKSQGRRRRRRPRGAGKKDETKVEAAKYDKEGVEICRAFSQNKSCRFGDQCTYSHGAPDPNAKPKDGGQAKAERRPRRAPRSKGPKECLDWAENKCEYGDECRFKHGDGDKRDLTPKPKPCYSWQENKSCEWGDECRFAHA